MNVFRFAGATRSCSGISLKTQELYAVVFLACYLDLFTDFISLNNTVMKLVFISSSRHPSCWRCSSTSRLPFGRSMCSLAKHPVVSCRVSGVFRCLTCLSGMLVVDVLSWVLWTFSRYLEAIAILPQLILLQRCGNVDNLTGQYVFFLGYAS
ncbi:hypothetical protein Taro_045103 [Colocasia esculenta]|uniref:Uncharacterized protein n=1 Tax=Colocasia esculenta TaxID=4460 RepID=A0A843WW76_COLES|nr:hypothetical protein [Colocasia esculenta]